MKVPITGRFLRGVAMRIRQDIWSLCRFVFFSCVFRNLSREWTPGKVDRTISSGSL